MAGSLGVALSLVRHTSLGKTHEAAVARAISAQAEAILSDGALSRKEKLLLLAGACFARRHREPAREAIILALDCGATWHEIEELLLACYGSRGPLVYLEARAALKDLPGAPAGGDGAGLVPVGSPADLEKTIDNILSYFGEKPLWVTILAENYPRILEGQQYIRELVYADGHLKRKIKELAFVTINCADRYVYGIKVHAKASQAAGASREEILEAMAVAILEGGMVAWIEGIGGYLDQEQ